MYLQFMKRLLHLILILPTVFFAQNYLDLVRVSYGESPYNAWENIMGGNQNSRITLFDADLTMPVVLNQNNVLITGANINRNELALGPENTRDQLWNLGLKIGWSHTIDPLWSTTLVALPKVAGDAQSLMFSELWIGGFALVKYQKSEGLIYKFGAYGSQEAFGFFTTPIFGFYYLSPSKKFEADVSLPIALNLNYTSHSWTYGIDYVGNGRSFLLKPNADGPRYVDLSALAFSSFVQKGNKSKSLLYRLKLGYATNDYEVYERGQKIGLGLSAFSFGDDRNQLNPEFSGSLFFKFEVIYRFHLQ
jgi:hypothetical protein